MQKSIRNGFSFLVFMGGAWLGPTTASAQTGAQNSAAQPIWTEATACAKINRRDSVFQAAKDSILASGGFKWDTLQHSDAQGASTMERVQRFATPGDSVAYVAIERTATATMDSALKNRKKLTCLDNEGQSYSVQPFPNGGTYRSYGFVLPIDQVLQLFPQVPDNLKKYLDELQQQQKTPGQ